MQLAMPLCTAVLLEENNGKVEYIDFRDLGMEAVWTTDVENFPAVILLYDKGNDFFKQPGLYVEWSPRRRRAKLPMGRQAMRSRTGVRLSRFPATALRSRNAGNGSTS
jgi:hypothetical protein